MQCKGANKTYVTKFLVLTLIILLGKNNNKHLHFVSYWNVCLVKYQISCFGLQSSSHSHLCNSIQLRKRSLSRQNYWRRVLEFLNATWWGQCRSSRTCSICKTEERFTLKATSKLILLAWLHSLLSVPHYCKLLTKSAACPEREWKNSGPVIM